jgi:hypothetical protein
MSDTAIKPGTRDGMILAFTLVLLLLVSLMGALILTSARTEVSISGNNRTGREAFNVADSAAGIVTLLSRIVIHPELGPPSQVLHAVAGPSFPMTVEINEDRFTLGALQAEAAEFDYAKRYREAVDPASVVTPHVTFRVNGVVVASAVVSLESTYPVQSGASEGANDAYDTGGGASVTLNVVVTVSGASPLTGLGSSEDPHSIVTAIYREYL